MLGAAAKMRYAVVYLHAPARNISIARNACLDAADADWIAFIDDDEIASPYWLATLLDCVGHTGVDAAFGPVQAVYGLETPDWMREQDHHSTIGQGRLLCWRGRPASSQARQAPLLDIARHAMHAGVCAGCLSIAAAQHYGD